MAGGASLQILIGHITPSGDAYAEFKVPAGSWPETIVAGPDGNLWFGDCRSYGNSLRHISPAGEIVSCPLPTPDRRPCGITTGPDGNLWFTETDTGSIGRLIP
jgi:virginiamycin B lyase